MMRKISLNDKEWHLAWYFGKEGILRNDHKNERLIGFIPAQVPGVVQEDLLEQGIIEDPYYDMNSYKAEWASQRNWIYKKFISLDEEVKGKRLRLHFEGVDYNAEFYMNGHLLGTHEGMFNAVEFDITNLVKFGEGNIIAVHIDEAPKEHGQVGYTSKVTTMKARVTYWWDFATRIIPLGIWDDVFIVEDDSIAFENVRILPRLSDDLNEGNIYTEVKISSKRRTRVELRIKLSFEGEKVYEEILSPYLSMGENLVNIHSTIDRPKLWWPNGYGEQNLYCCELLLLEDGKEIYNYNEHFGFKRVLRLPNEGFQNAPKYKFNVNGKDIFIKGWNWVPIDLMYGRDKTEKYTHLIKLAKEANVNMLRVWGGGLIEKEIFYRLCDESGIMIWQEFTQSSSGIDNFPNSEQWYIDMLSRYAVEVVKKRRNHVSLTIWCGGNELLDSMNIPLDENYPVLKMLDELVAQYGNDQIFLATSPYGKVFGLNLEILKKKSKPEEGTHVVYGQPHLEGKRDIHEETVELYDVHGPWMYLGLTEHYFLYNENTSALHSEFGVEGTVLYEDLKRFMSEEKAWPPTRENRIWSHHGAWFINLPMMEKVFGSIKDIKEYCKLSHYLQAEGLRYGIESNRRRMPQCGGTLPWQFNEPYPNAICTNSVDYYGKPKMAYYYVKKAYELVNVSLKYSSQIFKDRVNFEVWITSSLGLSIGTEIKLQIYSLKGSLLFSKLYHTGSMGSESPKKVASENFATEEDFLIVRVNSMHSTINEYIFVKGENLGSLRGLESTELEVEKRNKSILVKNVGNNAALFVNVTGADYENYIIMLPGEGKEFERLNENIDLRISYFNENINS
jgi:beta-mannosidase